MAHFFEFDPLSDPCLKEIEAIADRYLREGLDPARILCVLAAVAIKTAHTDPVYKQFYLDYFAEAVRGAGEVTIIKEE
jgi:hypothetical protein